MSYDIHFVLVGMDPKIGEVTETPGRVPHKSYERSSNRYHPSTPYQTAKLNKSLHHR